MSLNKTQIRGLLRRAESALGDAMVYLDKDEVENCTGMVDDVVADLRQAYQALEELSEG